MNRPVGLAGDIARGQKMVRRPASPLPVQLPTKRQVRKFVRGLGLISDIVPRQAGVRQPQVTKPMPAPPRPVPTAPTPAPRRVRTPIDPTRLSTVRVAPAQMTAARVAAAPPQPIRLPKLPAQLPQVPTQIPNRRQLRRIARAPGVEKNTKQIWEYAQYPLIAIVALASAYSTTIGQCLILVYGLMAIWQRWDSRQSFGIALFLLITIPLFQLIGQAGIAENVAVYVYELLVIGTILALIELHKSNRLHN